MEEVFGKVTWDKNVKTDYCSQCVGKYFTVWL